jgi:hypothetical protein
MVFEHAYTRNLVFSRRKILVDMKNDTTKFVQGSEKERKLGTKVVIQSSKNEGKKTSQVFCNFKISIHWVAQCSLLHGLNKKSYRQQNNVCMFCIQKTSKSLDI